jgi:lipid-A-disaccharide synthase
MKSIFNKPLKILVSTGETSGDEHASRLFAELGSLNIDFRAYGMCGQSLEDAGVQKIVNAESIGAVMGFGDVFFKLSKLKSALNTLKRSLNDDTPDAVILIDFPDFNLRLAKAAHEKGIPVFYFIPPKIWAWRSQRALQLEKFITRAAYIFPHEEAAAKKLGFTKGEFVGHPYCADPMMRPASIEEKRTLRARFGFSDAERLLVIAPGSRRGELSRHHLALQEAITLLTKKHPELQIAISQAPGVPLNTLSSIVPQNNLRVKIIPDAQLDLFRIADAGIIKSGTSTLQAAFFGFPFTMFFKAPAITGWIVKCFVKIKEFSLVNIIAPKTIKEILQNEVTGEILAQEAEALLYEEPYRNEILGRLESMRVLLANKSIQQSRSPYARTADLVFRMIQNKQK